MILEGLMNVLLRYMDTMLWFELPKLPPEVHEYIAKGFEYISAGAGILANYAPLGYLMTLFGILLAVDAGILIYHLVMWVIRKIPMAGMS